MLASRAGIESITTEEGQIIIRLFGGMQFTPQQRLLSFPDGVKMYPNQIRLNLKRVGKGWKKVLEGILGRVG